MDELVLSQEDQPKVRRSTHPGPQSALVRIFFYRDLNLEGRLLKNLTEAIRYARLICSD